MAQPVPAQAPGFLDTLPMLAFPILIFYLLLFRPQAKIRKQHEQMLKTLKKYDDVVTTGGLFGSVVNLKPDTVTLKIDENVRVEVERSAIARVVKSSSAEVEPAAAERRGA